MKFNRRTFCQLSAGSLLGASFRTVLGDTVQPQFTTKDGIIRVTGNNYTWEYTGSTDTFRLLDSQQRPIVKGAHQPAVVVTPSGQPGDHSSTPGHLKRQTVEGNRVVIEYEGVNGNASLISAWRFDEHGIWMEPLEYDCASASDIVSLHYFSDRTGTTPKPALRAGYYVLPGISEGSSISPVLRDNIHLNETIWLGRGSFIPGMHQQWGLPVHFFSGFSVDDAQGLRNMLTSGRCDAFTCGLADLPGGDLFLTLYQGFCSPTIQYRSDLWKHVRTPGRVTLGATLLWSVAPDYYQSIAAYYQGLLHAGLIQVPPRSEAKSSTALTPEFCTWGSQVDEHKEQNRLDEAFLDSTYASLKASGMKAGLFSIDDKWEEAYGNLEHSVTRLPHFEQFLDRLRADGYRIGIWAALMRCERPADLGLSEDHMLKRPDGSAYKTENYGGAHYYILDFTQPVVAEVLRKLVRRFIRRYKPDLFKFDFGYELPPVSIAAPQDKRYCGERLMAKGLDVVIRTMREENPNLVVMYYQLSPLFLEYFDLHSTDDLFLAVGEYGFEANRRMYFSSLLGALGVPTYGSSGYDWSSAPSIWFDSAAVGTIGSLNDFNADERGESGNRNAIAKYNGIAQILRKTSQFRVVPIGSVPEAPTFGAHARSWARYEDGQLVLLAYRPPHPDEGLSLGDPRGESLAASCIQSSVAVVAASFGNADLTHDSRIGLVPYGSGNVSLRRSTGRRATVIHHFLGGGKSQTEVPVQKDGLTIAVREQDQAGHPLEWVEVNFS